MQKATSGWIVKSDSRRYLDADGKFTDQQSAAEVFHRMLHANARIDALNLHGVAEPVEFDNWEPEMTKAANKDKDNRKEQKK